MKDRSVEQPKDEEANQEVARKAVDNTVKTPPVKPHPNWHPPANSKIEIGDNYSH